MKKGAKAINIANFFMQLMSKTLDYIYIYIYIYFNKLHTYDFLSSTCIITIFRIINYSGLREYKALALGKCKSYG